MANSLKQMETQQGLYNTVNHIHVCVCVCVGRTNYLQSEVKGKSLLLLE